MNRENLLRTMENLERNGMQVVLVPDREAARKQIENYLFEDAVVSFGGSVTLQECGIIDYLKAQDEEGNISLLDRSRPGLQPEDVEEILRDAFSADVYFSGTNAITEEGRLYNVDGNGNRVSAMIFGPQSVIVVAGTNKIVANDEEAIRRVREIAAPKNGVRLELETPCAKTGHCMDCMHPQRMCASYVFLGKQRKPGRIKVILVEEALGY